jgi:hypothetical protein
MYRFEPDAAWTSPRRALLYTNDLNNPLRYVDPDGRGTWGAVIDFAVDVGEGAAEAAGEGLLLTVGLVALPATAVVGAGFAAGEMVPPGTYVVGGGADHQDAQAWHDCCASRPDPTGPSPYEVTQAGMQAGMEASKPKSPRTPAGGGAVNGTPPANGAADVVTANGQRADANGNRIGPSGDTQVNTVVKNGEKAMNDASQADPRNGKNQSGVTHSADDKDPRHMHPSKDGKQPNKRGGNPHYLNGKKLKLNPNNPHGRPSQPTPQPPKKD